MILFFAPRDLIMIAIEEFRDKHCPELRLGQMIVCALWGKSDGDYEKFENLLFNISDEELLNLCEEQFKPFSTPQVEPFLKQ